MLFFVKITQAKEVNKSDQNTHSLVPAIIAIAIMFAIILLCAFSVSVVPKTTDMQENFSGVRQTTEHKTVDYETQIIEDGELEYGKTEIRVTGENGEITQEYEVTYEDGNIISKELIKEETTRDPVTEVIAKGTKILWHCIDATSYDKNPYNDNKCTSSTGEVRYVSDSQSIALDPTYSPGKSGAAYYNNK